MFFIASFWRGFEDAIDFKYLSHEQRSMQLMTTHMGFFLWQSKHLYIDLIIGIQGIPWVNDDEGSCMHYWMAFGSSRANWLLRAQNFMLSTKEIHFKLNLTTLAWEHCLRYILCKFCCSDSHFKCFSGQFSATCYVIF